MVRVLCLSLAVLSAVAFVYCQESEELKIEVTHAVPESECKRKSKTHDLLTMHYTGYLSNGSKFDSR